MIPLLRLYLSPLDATRFKVFVESPAGQREADSRLPFLDEGIDRRVTVLKALDATSFRPQDFPAEGEQAWMVRTGLLAQDRSAFLLTMREQIGWELYHALFPEERGLRELLRTSIAMTQASHTFPFLHVQIKIEADVARQGRARVADYPWELICDKDGFFARQVVFSRYIAYDGVVPHLSPVEKTTIVCISSTAYDPVQNLAPLSSQDQQAIRDGLHKADPSRLRADVLTPATVGRLRAYLTEQREEAAPTVLHFDGHGFFGKRCTHVLPNNKACSMMHSGRAATVCTKCGAPLPAEPQGFLLFEGETRASPQYVSAQEVGDLLQATKVALVVLSACRSGFSQGSETILNGVA